MLQRQSIGTSVCRQVINDVALQPRKRHITRTFEQEGAGILRRLKRKNIIKKAIDLAKTDAARQVSKIIFDSLPQDKREIIQEKIKPIASRVVEGLEDYAGSGLSVAGAGGSAGSGLSVAGAGGSVGSGLSVAGAGGSVGVSGKNLPGDVLRKKLLQKMVREQKMKSLGDRQKTSPIKGGNLVIPTTNNKMGSVSMGKTLPLTSNYKIKGGFITPTILIASLLTSAASAAGSEIVKKLAGRGMKSNIKKIAKELHITYRDLSPEDKKAIKKGFHKLRKDKGSVLEVAKSLAPIALRITKKKMGMMGMGEIPTKEFKNAFVKKFMRALQ